MRSEEATPARLQNKTSATKPVSESGQDKREKTSPPDPEVRQRKSRRRFSAAYKKRILEEADACDESGQIGALLRREGLYSATLAQWRRQRREKGVEGLAPKKRGPQSTRDPQAEKIRQLERENTRLRRNLEESKLIIEIQKKTSALLGIKLSDVSEHEKIVFGDEET
jgi:transposase-like protein